MKPVYFETQAAIHHWLIANHDTVTELWVGFYKKASGKPSVTYPEALEEALCFGWIDGVRRAVDGDRYMQRFTPRRPGSQWSAVNVRRVEGLLAVGRMQPAGIAAFEARDMTASEQAGLGAGARLSPEHEAALQARPEAWAFIQAQPAWYQRAVAGWIMDAKREETLIADSDVGEWIGPLRRAT
jgi:uncharacterized protein YdeI (YjbR/CyaY-like superfamily)